MTVLSGISTAATDEDDATLVRRFQSTTDPQARGLLFEKLYAAHRQRLYGFCLKRLLPDRDAAREALQETFLTAWAQLDKLEHPEALESWLYRIAWRRCAQQRRKQGLATGVPVDGWEESTGRKTAHRLRQIAADDADFAARRRRVLVLVRNIAAAQGPGRQRFLDLYVGEELTGDTLAHRLGRATGATKEDNEALRAAFRSTVLATDPRNRKACGRLAGILATAVTYWTAQAASEQRAGHAAAADRARRIKEALERFLADTDPDSTKALPEVVCRTVTRHTGQCPTCRGNAERSVARWFPAVAPFAFTDVIMDVVRDGFDLVSADAPADGGAVTEVKGGENSRTVGRANGRSGGSPGRPGRPSRSPGIGRRITVNTLVALALSLGVVYGSGGADLPMAQLLWSSPAPSGSDEQRGTGPVSGADPARRTPPSRTNSAHTDPAHTDPARTGSGQRPNSSAATSPATRPAPASEEAADPATGPADLSPPPASTQAVTGPPPAADAPAGEQVPDEEPTGTQPSGQPPTDPDPGSGSSSNSGSGSGSGSGNGSAQMQATQSQSSSSSPSGTGPFVQHPSAYQGLLSPSTSATDDEPG
ncbi:sigma factor [Streptomyces rimosus]|uniref:sigma factor n=1 Tax=Streptomyces rimosus TaxID=1927 RepID=UPI0004C5FD96|nr:sigma factor [Streptomyces rimosus]